MFKLKRHFVHNLLVILIIFVIFLPSSFSQTHPPPLKGMTLGLFNQDPHYEYQSELAELKKLGVNAILLTVPWYQHDIRSNIIQPHPETQKDASTMGDEMLAKIIGHAHQLNLKVLLFPFLRFDVRGPKDWRGVLAPKIFALWARNYKNFILHYADLSEKNGVEILSVGSELGSLEDKSLFWKDLIRKVRQRYHGKLTYSANWDHYTHPTFWRGLDFLSISSYFELSNNPNPTLSELLEKWQQIKKILLAFKAKYSQKLIITEVGYPSLDGAAKAPWNYFAPTPVDLEEQALCYKAFIQTWDKIQELEGVFWWNWFGPGGPKDKDYTPRGKPAEALLRDWYRND